MPLLFKKTVDGNYVDGSRFIIYPCLQRPHIGKYLLYDTNTHTSEYGTLAHCKQHAQRLVSRATTVPTNVGRKLSLK
jgi:hypothetical protein